MKSYEVLVTYCKKRFVINNSSETIFDNYIFTPFKEVKIDWNSVYLCSTFICKAINPSFQLVQESINTIKSSMLS